MLKDLIKVSNRLDSLGLTKEADYLDAVIRKISGRKMVPYGAAIEELAITDETESEDDERVHESQMSPEHKLISERGGKFKLESMSPEKREALKSQFPEAYDALYGEGSLHELGRKPARLLYEETFGINPELQREYWESKGR